MPTYNCDLCNKLFIKKDNYIKHKNRKIKCIENIYTNNCIYCNKTFKNKGNVSRHMANNCKILKKIQDEKEEIFNKLVELEKENNKLKNQLIHKPINNTTINNNNKLTNNGIINNITIVAYGKEDMDKINKNDILKAVSRGYKSAVHLTKTIHFNNKYPDYHNVYIPSMKESYAMTYDGNKWTLVQKNKLINDIYDDKKYFIEENLEDFTKSLSAYKINALKKWLQSDEDDHTCIKDIKKNIELVLYNERDKPMKIKKEIENK
jgi:hypothetical protein